MKPRAGSGSVCRIGSPRVRRRSCTAPGRPEVEIFMKCEKQGALLPGEPPVRSSMPKGWEARPTPTGPSDHHLRAPGHLAPDTANKCSLPRPGSKVHISPACWQAFGQHQAPHRALGRQKRFHMCPWPPSLQRGHTPDPGVIGNKLVTRTPHFSSLGSDFLF